MRDSSIRILRKSYHPFIPSLTASADNFLPSLFSQMPETKNFQLTTFPNPFFLAQASCNNSMHSALPLHTLESLHFPPALNTVRRKTKRDKDERRQQKIRSSVCLNFTVSCCSSNTMIFFFFISSPVELTALIRKNRRSKMMLYLMDSRYRNHN